MLKVNAKKHAVQIMKLWLSIANILIEYQIKGKDDHAGAFF